MNRRILRAVFLAIGASVFSFEASAHPPVSVQGRTLAIQACSACHQVAETQGPSTPVLNPDTLEHVTAPSFVQIARKYGKDTKALRAFILAPTHPMREQQFLPHDLDAIIVYIRYLDTRH